jgi:pimeloyl-ACP methyl ester carboxylesterase
MPANLIEFTNTKNETLRGILTLPKSNSAKSAVIMLHGFSRSGSTEPKFKKLADELSTKNIASFRFDLPGLGLSDGQFTDSDIKSWSSDLESAIQIFIQTTNCKNISFVGHSVGCCILAEYLSNINPDRFAKIVLLSPALNQVDLLRYWFTQSQAKKSHSETDITWQNYLDYFDPKVFQKDIERPDKIAKSEYIGSRYFESVKDLDLSFVFQNFQHKILHVHGLKDFTVPIQSLNIKFQNQILVSNGDHDMEKPDQRSKWLAKVSEYLVD